MNPFWMRGFEYLLRSLPEVGYLSLDRYLGDVITVRMQGIQVLVVSQRIEYVHALFSLYLFIYILYLCLSICSPI